MNHSAETLFLLLRASIGRGAQILKEPVDWREVYDISCAQGVSAISIDGLQSIYGMYPEMELSLDDETMEDVKYEWFASVFQAEDEYQAYVEKVQGLMAFYRSVDIPTLLLKGFGLGLNYPIPAHRPSGDIDIYQFGNWAKADTMVINEMGITVDNSHHHHSVFSYKGLIVENHYDFVNVHSHRSNVSIENTLKRIASVGDSVDGIDLPSSDFNALFVIRHIAIHFAAEGMCLRQLLDWALFVEKHSSEVNWNMAWLYYRKWNMHKFVLCMDEIAIRYLGFDRDCFCIPSEFSDFGENQKVLITRVLEEIFNPTTFPTDKRNVLSYVICRFRQWWNSRWKHKIVYSDSLLSTFFTQVFSHLLKPATLIGK